MSSIVDRISQADFSKETDFKNTLRRKLFGEQDNKGSGKVINSPIRFQSLSIEDLEMVSAAGELHMRREIQDKFREDKPDQ